MRPRSPTARVAMAALAFAMTTGMNPASAATQMFKCFIDKRTVYQQQACPANAEPAPTAASAPPAGTGLPGANQAASTAQRGALRPASRPASSAPATPR